MPEAVRELQQQFSSSCPYLLSLLQQRHLTEFPFFSSFFFQGMRCRQLRRVVRDTVEASLSVLALSGVNSITWATPENLTFLTRFKNVRTLHW